MVDGGFETFNLQRIYEKEIEMVDHEIVTIALLVMAAISVGMSNLIDGLTYYVQHKSTLTWNRLLRQTTYVGSAFYILGLCALGNILIVYEIPPILLFLCGIGILSCMPIQRMSISDLFDYRTSLGTLYHVGVASVSIGCVGILYDLFN